MPETFSEKEKNLAREVSKGAASREVLKEKLKSMGMDFIGAGGESIVFKPTGSEGKVYAIYRDRYGSEIHAKVTFYLSRILNTLFPHNFPKIFAGYEKFSVEGLSGTVRQEIVGESGENVSSRAVHPFSGIEKIMDRLWIPVKIDKNTSENFILDSKGDEYYVDTPKLEVYYDKSTGVYEEPNWRLDLIMEYMGEHPDLYNAVDIKTVENSINRITALTKNGFTKYQYSKE